MTSNDPPDSALTPWGWAADIHQNSSIDSNHNNGSDKEHDEHVTPYSILFLFGVFLIGALVRMLLKKIRLPYTMVLFVLGAIFGTASNYFPALRAYTELAHMSPHYILYIFLPILIFESAFALDAHTFTRCFVQCLILAVPGLLIVTALTAVLSVNILPYSWSWSTALLFGCILSATDPVAVVALLREVGTSITLSTLVEGESLLNDGSAIVAYAVLIDLVVPGNDVNAAGIVIKFCQISLGGPLLGIVMGKISVFCLSNVFNDAVVEITITLSSAYLTYYLAEAVFKVSGVLSLVALGVVISAEKDSISPEVEAFVHKFWEKLSYLANTVIFVIVGIVVAEAADYIERQDWFLICATYIGSTVFRFMMIGILGPVLTRLGYGLRWQEAVVMTWGGLRGAVGLCLALLVSEQEGIDKETVGHKILIHVSGIVLLTLMVNATTMKPLLKVLGMSDISKWKRHNMTVAVRHLQDIQSRSIHVQKNNQFFTDAYWKEVEDITTIKDQFTKPKRKLKLLNNETEAEDDGAESDTGSYTLLRFSSCPDCDQQHIISPSNKEHEEMFNEARLRMINAEKVSYWRQFENGLLAQENVRVLLSAADQAADKDKGFITVEELKSNWKIPFVYDWMERKLRNPVSRKMSLSSATSNEYPKGAGCLPLFKYGLRHRAFDYVVYVLILLSVIPLSLEAVYRLNPETRTEHKTICDILQIVNYIFFGLYLVEVSLKLIKCGCLRFWRSHWNRFDAVILILFILELILHFIADYGLMPESKEIPSLVMSYTILRIVRFVRVLRLFKHLRYRLLCAVNSHINSYLYAGYDIGCAFLMGEEEVIKMVEEIVDYQPIAKELQTVCEQNRSQIVRELALLQEEHSSVAVAVKTRHAARHVLNNSRDELNDLKERGLLDDGVYELLIGAIEKQMKRLISAQKTILPAPATDLLKNVEWIGDSEEIFEYIKSRAVVLKFPKGKRLHSCGDSPAGIYIITVGIVKIVGHVVDALGEGDGQLPNTDSFHWFSSQGPFEDCLTAGNVLGELGALTKKAKSVSAICETEVQAFHIRQEDMEHAFTVFKDHPSIEYKLWRTCALRIAKSVLKNDNPQYTNWSITRIMMHLQKAVLPKIGPENSFTLESEMQDVILIQGVAEDENTGEIYKGVTNIPRTVHTLRFQQVEKIRPLLLVVGTLDLTGQAGGTIQNQSEWADRKQRWSICPPATNLCLLHHVRRRSAVPMLMRSNRRPSRTSGSSWVESLPEYFGGGNERTYSQPVDLADERNAVPRIVIQPDITVSLPMENIPGEISIAVTPKTRSRRRSTLDLPYHLRATTQDSSAM